MGFPVLAAVPRPPTSARFGARRGGHHSVSCFLSAVLAGRRGSRRGQRRPPLRTRLSEPASGTRVWASWHAQTLDMHRQARSMPAKCLRARNRASSSRTRIVPKLCVRACIHDIFCGTICSKRIVSVMSGVELEALIRAAFLEDYRSFPSSHNNGLATPSQAPYPRG